MSISARRMMRNTPDDSTPPPAGANFKRGWVDDGPLASASPSIPSRPRNPTDSVYNWAYATAGLRHSVLNVGIRELINVTSSGTTTYIAGSLETRLSAITAWNTANPTKKITAHIRLHVGERAPDMWKSICGQVHVIDKSFNKDAWVPKWWVGSYRTVYENAMNALAPAIDALPLIGTVNAPGGSPFYPEPCLFFFSDDANRPSLISAGWKHDAHESFQSWFPTIMGVFERVGVEVALNPYQDMNDSGALTTQNTTVYKTIANALMTTVGNRAVLANYSVADWRITLGGMRDMYNWMQTQHENHRAWFGAQLARPQVITDLADIETVQVWDDLGDWAANKGMNFLETTGKGNGKGAANVWPTAYNNDPGDVAAFIRIGGLLTGNPAP
jgi:hypothetical protein